MQDGLYSGANFHIYRSTKTALNMIMIYYGKSLENDGFVVSASDPGYCGEWPSFCRVPVNPCL